MLVVTVVMVVLIALIGGWLLDGRRLELDRVTIEWSVDALTDSLVD